MHRLYRYVAVMLAVLFALSLLVLDSEASSPRYSLYMIHNPGVCRPCHKFLSSEYRVYRNGPRNAVLPLRVLVMNDISSIPEHFAVAYNEGKVSSFKRSVPTFILYDLTKNREAARIEGYDKDTFYEQLDLLVEALGVQNP